MFMRLSNTRLDLEVSIFDVQADTAIGNDFVDGLEIYDAANNVEVDIASVQIICELNNGTLQTIEWRDKDGNLVGNSPDLSKTASSKCRSVRD